MASERATLYDRLRALIALGGVEIPPRDPVDWLRDVVGDDLVDLRHLADAKGRGKEHGTFDPVAACVHQTAFARRESAPDSGYVEIPAHVVIRQSGRVLLLHDLRALMHHAHALNRVSFGIEVECREPGERDVPRTFWRRKSEKKAGKTLAELIRPVRPIQLVRLREVIQWAEREVLERKLTVYCHRQGHRSRTSDCGQAIWSSVSAWARTDPQKTFGSGTPVPTVWAVPVS